MNRKFVYCLLICILLSTVLALSGLAQTAAVDSSQKPSVDDQEFRRLAEKAARAREGNRDAEALQAYEQLVQLRPAWAEGWWYLGTLHFDREQFTAARAAFDKLVTLEPQNGQGWGLLGISEFKTGEMNLALEHLTKARVSGFGDNQDLARAVRLHQAILLTRTRRYEEALAILVGFGIEHRESPVVLDAMGCAALRIAEPMESLSPDRHEMIRLFGKATFLAAERKMDEAFKVYEQLEARYHGKPNVSYVFGLALLVVREDPERAMPYFEAELEKDPNHVPAMLRLAFRMLDTNQFERCTAYARKLIELEPSNYAGYYLMGRIHLYKREFSQAITLLEKSAALAPELAAIQYALAQAYQRAGRQEESLKARGRFSQLDAIEKQRQEGNPAAAQFLTFPNYGKNEHVPQQQGIASPALVDENPAAGDSGTFDRIKLRAEQARESGELTAAIQTYGQLVRLRPDWAEGWWYLGSINYDADQYAAAASAFEKLLALDPQNSQAWGLLGLCEYRLDKHAEALEHLTRSRNLGVDRMREISRVVRLHQAILLNRSRQFEAALFVLNTYASEHQEADAVLDAMGMSVLRISDPVESLSQEQREMIRKFGRAAYLDAEQKPEESFRLYEELEVQYRGRPNVAYALGTALLVQREPEKAVASFKQELERDPAHEAALLQIALQMMAWGKFEEGAAYSQRAVDASPDNFAGYYALGRSHLYMNNLPQAIESLEKAAAIAPTVAIVHYNLSQAYQRANRPEDAARARAQFEKVKALNKDRRGDIFVTLEDLQSTQPKPR
ncbi:MAG TPA: tetratricopeptide repeat protein [Acidobacteriota bacterium]|nr:tetratricopeptide repeat protein [Acidobacteriota bacterium]